MGNIDTPIAEFRASIYKDSFGFDVSVYQKDTDIYRVESEGLLNDTYASFDDFLDDLVLQNPLWFTYYYVRVDKPYKQAVESKLKDTIYKVFHWLDHSVLCTRANWQFDVEPINNLVAATIKECVANENRLSLLSDPHARIH